ncbi:MAG: pyrroloquinoline quinone-dependent dehydrogenase [Acidobacteriaceae bacterium]
MMNRLSIFLILAVCLPGIGNSSSQRMSPPSSAASDGPAIAPRDNAKDPQHAARRDWAVVNGSPGDSHYSSLTQIDRTNVAKLQEVWRYDTKEQGGLEANPIVINGVLYAYTPRQEVIALDAATGKLIWKFSSGINGTESYRGLAYWTNGSDKRVLAGIMHFLYALNATTGKAIPTFGENGRIDLRKGLGRDPELQSIALDSPGAVYKDLIIVGGMEPETLPAPPGDIRAYDVRSGKLRWSFHTIPHPGEFGYNTWPKDAWKYSGAANNWPGMAVDTKRGIIYVPTGSAAADFYGANRIGNDLFADSLIALDAETGKRIWSFQAVRHDLWDRDFPAPPTLLEIRRNGKEIPAIAQTTKQGYLYLFNRIDGKPLFPIEYRKYPASTVPGEVAATEQPLPTRPAPFARQLLTEDILTHRTPAAHQWALEQFRKMRSDGQFVPWSLNRATVLLPSFEGGAEWGGSAVDPATDILYVNSNDYASVGTMVKIEGATGGQATYLSQCSVCHGENRAGSSQFPSLIGIGNRLTSHQIAETIHHGRGRMPGFPGIQGYPLDQLIEFLKSGTQAVHGSETASSSATYQVVPGYKQFLDPQGYPAVEPPWGTLNAIDLNTGDYVWKIPFGQYPKLVAQGMPNTGSENFGGPIVTAGGLLFIGATDWDNKFRAFDKATGKLLWQTALPFPGNATPATYQVNGRQYVVIASGGGDLVRGVPRGGVYIAYALPQ